MLYNIIGIRFIFHIQFTAPKMMKNIDLINPIIVKPM